MTPAGHISYAQPVNRVVLVTGANRGLGLEVARQLARRGDRVFMGSRVLDAGELAAAPLRAEGLDVLDVDLDVTDQHSIARAMALVDDTSGRLDALVNNAGADYDTWERAASVDFATVDHALATNLVGAWRMVVAFVPLLRHSEHPRIVNVSSESGSLATMGAGTPAYSVSKAGLNALTRVLAAELRSEGILINSVCPGWVATDMGGRGGRPVADGAASIVWGVDLPDDGPSGGFFRDGRPLPW
jgi:NAD(P)-dependent dehydrogenase (short-subunit alcohol dehydrogenase family)